jgi:hypothetical protein
MAGRAELVGEGQEAVGLTLRVVKQQYLGHDSALYADKAVTPTGDQEKLAAYRARGLGISLSESRGVLF